MLCDGDAYDGIWAWFKRQSLMDLVCVFGQKQREVVKGCQFHGGGGSGG